MVTLVVQTLVAVLQHAPRAWVVQLAGVQGVEPSHEPPLKTQSQLVEVAQKPAPPVMGTKQHEPKMGVWVQVLGVQVPVGSKIQTGGQPAGPLVVAMQAPVQGWQQDPNGGQLKPMVPQVWLGKKMPGHCDAEVTR